MHPERLHVFIALFMDTEQDAHTDGKTAATASNLNNVRLLKIERRGRYNYHCNEMSTRSIVK